MSNISYIDKSNKTVFFEDGSNITYLNFLKVFREFLRNRICGETLVPGDMERFMRRTSGKNLSMLMKGKKMEGYMEGSMDRMLTAKQKLAIGTILAIIIVIMVVVIVLKNMGILNF